MPSLADLLRNKNPYDNILSDAVQGSISNAESLGRGAAVAPIGIFGDLNALGREYITPRLPAKVRGIFESLPAAPTTEEILVNIPRGTQARRESAGMEQLGAAMNPMGPVEAAKGAVKGAGVYGRLAAQDIGAGLAGEPTRSVLGQLAPKPLKIFVGENSKTWDKIDAIRAQAMEKIGTSPEEIWRETGTFRGPEGKWRQEISDENLNINDYRNTGGAIVIKHPELQAAYDQLPRGVKVVPTPEYKQMASYQAPSRELDWQLGEGGVLRVPSNEPTPKDVYAHELQHAVQAKEGFAGGGSPDRMIVILEDLAKKKREEARKYFDLSSNKDPLNPQIIKPSARQKGLDLEKEARQLEDKAMIAYHSEQAKMDLYNQLAGEAEARAVQERFNMTPEERRATFPYKSYDVPKEQLIIRGVY